MHKACARCHEVKPVEEFPVRRERRSGRGSYCKPCNVARQREQGHGGYAARLTTCPGCGEDRSTTSPAGTRCRACYHRAQRHPDYDQRGPARGVKRPPLPLHRSSILERDEWTCGICHEAIDRTLAYPDNFCAVIDHVFPVMAGGPNEEWNLQAAHNICNRIKGADATDALYDQAMAAKLALTGSV